MAARLNPEQFWRLSLAVPDEFHPAEAHGTAGARDEVDAADVDVDFGEVPSQEGFPLLALQELKPQQHPRLWGDLQALGDECRSQPEGGIGHHTVELPPILLPCEVARGIGRVAVGGDEVVGRDGRPDRFDGFCDGTAAHAGFQDAFARTYLGDADDVLHAMGGRRVEVVRIGVYLSAVGGTDVSLDGCVGESAELPPPGLGAAAGIEPARWGASTPPSPFGSYYSPKGINARRHSVRDISRSVTRRPVNNR